MAIALTCEFQAKRSRQQSSAQHIFNTGEGAAGARITQESSAPAWTLGENFQLRETRAERPLTVSGGSAGSSSSSSESSRAVRARLAAPAPASSPSSSSASPCGIYVCYAACLTYVYHATCGRSLILPCRPCAACPLEFSPGYVWTRPMCNPACVMNTHLQQGTRQPNLHMHDWTLSVCGSPHAPSRAPQGLHPPGRRWRAVRARRGGASGGCRCRARAGAEAARHLRGRLAGSVPPPHPRRSTPGPPL